nr:nucleotide disphospho-sugar-binding domain-containing protein [Saccharopolyspora spinosa]
MEQTASNVAQSSLDQLPEYLRLAEAWRPSVLLVDVCALIGRVLGGLLDLPVVLHRWGVDPTAGPFSDRAHELLDPVCRHHGLTGLPTPELILDPCPPSLQASDAPQGAPVQYVPYNGSGAFPAWGAARTSARRVCICMGRMVLNATGPAPLLRAVAAATELPGVEAVIAVPPEHRALLTDLPDNARIAESVPLNLFLRTCELVICAGGSGTAFTATRLGIPQLVLPQYFDQFDYARNLAAAGAASACRMSRPSPTTNSSPTQSQRCSATPASLLRQSNSATRSRPCPIPPRWCGRWRTLRPSVPDELVTREQLDPENRCPPRTRCTWTCSRRYSPTRFTVIGRIRTPGRTQAVDQFFEHVDRGALGRGFPIATAVAGPVRRLEILDDVQTTWADVRKQGLEGFLDVVVDMAAVVDDNVERPDLPRHVFQEFRIALVTSQLSHSVPFVPGFLENVQPVNETSPEVPLPHAQRSTTEFGA